MTDTFDPAVARRAQSEFHVHELLREMSAGALSSRSQDLVTAMGGVIRDRHSVEIPFGALRDLSAGTASAGGYLVATDTRAAVGALAPVSAVIGAGATVLANLEGMQAVPRISSSVSTHWLQTETTETTANQPTIAQVTLSPKTAGAYTPFTRQLALQQPDLARVLEQDMRTALASMVDQGALEGSGVAGQPAGILGNALMTTISGTSIAWTDIVGMKKTVLAANGALGSMAFIADPATAEILETREKASGSGFILDGGRIAGLRCITSANVPAGTLICAHWPSVVVAFWGGMTLEVNPYQGFAAGVMGARMMVSMDVHMTSGAAVAATGCS